MQTHSGGVNFSPKKITFPFGNSKRRNERHVPFEKPTELASSPVASNQNLAPDSGIQHFSFCSLGSSRNIRDILRSIGVVSEMTTEESVKFPSSISRSCNCAVIRRYASMIQNPSDDEIAIIYLAFLMGWGNAEEVAPQMGFKSTRPLRMILEQKAIKTPTAEPLFETRQSQASADFYILARVQVRAKAALRLVAFRLLNTWCIWFGAARSCLWHIRLQSAKELPNVTLGAAPVLCPDGSLRDQPSTSARAASIGNLLAIYPWLDIVHLRIFLMGFDAGEQIHGRTDGSGTGTQSASPS